jgi:hypothetical protein
LIAYALDGIKNFTVVTAENSAPSKKRQNRKIPDVCNDFNIQCINPFEFNRILKFTTSWKNKNI